MAALPELAKCATFLQSIQDQNRLLCVASDPSDPKSGCASRSDFRAAVHNLILDGPLVEMSKLDGAATGKWSGRTPPKYKEAANILKCASLFRMCTPDVKQVIPPCRPVAYNLPAPLVSNTNAKYWERYLMPDFNWVHHHDANVVCFGYRLPLPSNRAVLIGACPAKDKSPNPMEFVSVQVNLCYMYRYLITHGWPRSSIITFGFDDALTLNNMHQFAPRTTEDFQLVKPYVCGDMVLDYSGDEAVNPDNIVAVLQGRPAKCNVKSVKEATAKHEQGALGGTNFCSGRTLDNSEHDNVLVFYDGHGYGLSFLNGWLEFSGLFVGSTEGATMLNVYPKVISQNTIKQLIKEDMRYNSLVFYINACKSGDIFDDWNDELAKYNAYVMTAVPAGESSYNFKDYSAKFEVNKKEWKTPVATLFSVMVMDDLLRSDLTATTIAQQRERIQARGPLFPQYIVKGNKPFRPVHKSVANPYAFGSKTLAAEGKLSDHFLGAVFNTWLNGEWKLMNDLKYMLCTRTLDGKPLTQYTEFKTLLTQSLANGEKKLATLKPTDAKYSDTAERVRTVKTLLESNLAANYLRFIVDWVRGDVTQVVAGTRLLGACRKAKLQSSDDLCRCLGYSQSGTKPYDYKVIAPPVPNNDPLLKRVQKPTVLTYRNPTYEHDGIFEVDIIKVTGVESPGWGASYLIECQLADHTFTVPSAKGSSHDFVPMKQVIVPQIPARYLGCRLFGRNMFGIENDLAWFYKSVHTAVTKGQFEGGVSAEKTASNGDDGDSANSPDAAQLFVKMVFKKLH